MVRMAYYVYEAGNCPGCGAFLGTLEAQGGRRRTYCKDACKQAAYRKRKAENRNSGVLRNAIERELDQTLHLMTCDCGRGLWTTHGNTQIGQIRCSLCNTQFRAAGR